VDEVIGEEPINWLGRAEPPRAAGGAAAPSAKSPQPQTRALPKAAAPAAAPVNIQPSRESDKLAADMAALATSLAELEETLRNFEGCNLRQMASNTVFGRGNADAKVMIMDAPPAAEEDRSGSPFAGASGEMLTKMLGAIGLKSEDCYYAACLPWRPPGGRTPTAEEAAICHPFAARHIQLQKPEIVLLCGEAAAFLLQKKEGINKLRGKWSPFETDTPPVQPLAIFHPNFLMEHPASKRLAWADLLKLKAAL
jgi:DNA polymerase